MNFGNLTANQDIAQLPGTTDGASAGVGKIGETFQAGIPTDIGVAAVLWRSFVLQTIFAGVAAAVIVNLFPRRPR